MKVMEQRPNQSAGPWDFSGPMRGCRLCTSQCHLRLGSVGFENKCGRVRLGSNFIGSVSGRVYLFFIIIYARRVRVRSDSGRFGSGTDFRTREDLYSTLHTVNLLFRLCLHCYNKRIYLWCITQCCESTV